MAIARVHVQGDGDATLMVDPDGIATGDALTTTTKTLLSQIRIN